MGQSSQDINHNVINSSFWVLMSRIVTRLLGFIRIIIVARLLSPNEFGLFGIISLTMSAMETISRVGLDQALIQMDIGVKKYFNTVWTFNVGRGVALFSVLALISPLIGEFFSEPEVIWLLIIFGISFIFKGFSNIGVVEFRKEMNFKKLFYLNFLSVSFGVIVSLVLAFLLRDVLALIGGGVSEALAYMLVSYIIHPYRPKISWDNEAFRELFNFGKWITGSNILVFALTEGDDLIAGKLLGTVALGYYQMSFRISSLPATELMRMLNQVMFPAYSKIKNSVRLLQQTFLKTFSMSAAFIMLIGGLIIALANDFTQIFLGTKWAGIVVPMQVLAIWGVIRALGGSTSPIFLALGKPKIITYFQAGMLVMMGMIIIPLTKKYGVVGTSWAVVLSNLLVHWIRYPLLSRYTKINLWTLLKVILLPLLSSILMNAGIYILKRSFPFFTVPKLLSMLILAFSGSIFYGMTLLLYSKWFNYDVMKLIINAIKVILERKNLRALISGNQ